MDLVRLWTEWEIQMLVLYSLSLQIILLLFAGIRRRTVSKVLRILLWLAYLSADFIAIYALGHLSTSQCKGDQPRRRQLVAFWAPFLLLHLGGQDTITAYSLEDNRLWRRHFLTFGAQVVMAAYVLYKSIAGSGLLVPAAILMFLAGVLKYGERVWALSCADLDNLRRSIGSERPPLRDHADAGLNAQFSLRFFRRLFVDQTILFVEEDDLVLQPVVKAENAYSVVEHELSLMYDVLYTKAAVIHTWYGYSIRLASFLSIVAALVLFSGFSKDGYSRADVAITYVLLIGASVLEINAICRALLSSWTCAALYYKHWPRLLCVVLALRRLIIFPKTKRRWSDSMGQHNLIDYCINPTSFWEVPLTVYVKVLLKKFSLELKSFILLECAPEYVKASLDLKSLISQELKKKAVHVRYGRATIAELKNSRGQWVLERRRHDLSNLLDRGSDGNPDGSTSQQLGSPYQVLCSSVEGIAFDESVLVWHIATDMFLRFRETSDEPHEVAIVGAVRALSNYMVFLLLEHPSMLPGGIMRSRYNDSCSILRNQDFGQGQAAESILSRLMSTHFFEMAHTPRDASLRGATQLARLLMHSRKEILEVVAEVWVEMLCYAANNCSGGFHAEQLSKGGELATVVWFLMAHYGVEGRLLRLYGIPLRPLDENSIGDEP